jgi:hypothetical protein
LQLDIIAQLLNFNAPRLDALIPKGQLPSAASTASRTTAGVK